MLPRAPAKSVEWNSSLWNVKQTLRANGAISRPKNSTDVSYSIWFRVAIILRLLRGMKRRFDVSVKNLTKVGRVFGPQGKLSWCIESEDSLWVCIRTFSIHLDTVDITSFFHRTKYKGRTVEDIVTKATPMLLAWFVSRNLSESIPDLPDLSSFFFFDSDVPSPWSQTRFRGI